MATDPNTTSNSFSTILASFIRLQNNALTTLQQIQQATVSQADTLNVTVTSDSGTKNTYTIPSFGYLKNSIARIDATIQKLMGFDGSDAFIRLPDGSFKRIYQASFITNPKPVGLVTVPDKFFAENNWFFESLYTPALKVSFDVTPYIPQQESKIFVKRLILNLGEDATKISYFNNSIKGRNDIDYLKFMVDLQKNNINYFTDEGPIDLPLSIVRYTGDFIVVNYEDREITNPDASTSKKRWYLFDKLTYTDNLTTSKNTLVLKVGDKMIKNETMFEVIEIDTTTKYLRVKRLSGYDSLVIGEGANFYSETFSPKLANVGIGFNEYDVIFFRTINDEENLISTIYSPGIAFYTNDLTIDGATGKVSLKDFYKDNVLDFGNQLLSQAKEGMISAVDGITPDAPTLNASSFQVVAINDHKLDQAEVVSIRKKQADKVTIASEISELSKAIDKKKEELNSKKFNSGTERRSVKSELDSLVRERGTKSSLYTSIVQELASLAQQNIAALDTPKYRIRGFFGLPNPKQSDKTGPQNVIQFITYYRYVRPDGSQSNVKQYDYVDQSGQTKRGTYSNLTTTRSNIRNKVYDVGTGKYIWAAENVENADAININQVDIPITKGEKVEFYVVSVSEAGWPLNPLLSEGSSTITVEFPNDLSSEDEATIALQQASQQIVKVQIENDLAAKGLDIHLSSSFNAIEKYYAHDADVISSNFYTPEGNVISLYQKLQELQTRIASLEDRLNKVAGVLAVYIIDPDTNAKVAVNNSDVIQLFAGYYKDYVSLLPAAEQPGAIVNKVYQIAIQNSEATPLQLIATFPGGIGGALPTTLPVAAPVVPIPTLPTQYDATALFSSITDPDYNKFRKYDRTPIVQVSVSPSDTNNANKYATAYFQAGQTTGQYMYSRFKDIGLVTDLYQDLPLSFRAIVPNLPTPGADTFVWSGTYTATVPDNLGTLTTFCIHTDHPALNDGSGTPFPLLQSPPVTIDTITGLPLSPESTSTFRHAAFLNTQVATKGGWSPQLSYYQNFLQNAGPSPYATPYTPATFNELPDKFGFVNNDRYLIGEYTCGSYLFLGPSTFNQLNVNGIDARASTIVKQGDENAIIIPVIFQFRMQDYYGAGGASGYVGGYKGPGAYPTQLQYSRRIGIDIYAQDESIFSFDIQVSATYKKTSISQVVATATPSINKEQQKIVYTKNTIKTLTA